MKSALRKTMQALLVGLACTTVVALLYWTGRLETLELWTLDLRFKWIARHSPTPPPADVAIITLDQASIEHVSRTMGYRWPWPRAFYGKLIDYLAHCGARAVVFDVFFTEPDFNRDEISGEESDAALVEATRRSARVYHSYILREQGFAPAADEVAALERSCRVDLPGLVPSPFASVALPSTALITASRLTGFANILPERDNIFRRVPLVARFGDRLVLGLPLAAAWDMEGRPPLRAENGTLAMGDGRRIPIDEAGRLFLWWYGSPDDPTPAFVSYPAAAVLRSALRSAQGQAPDIDAAAFTNKVVLIGSTAPGLFDVRATPLARGTPGVRIQATALANLIHGDFVTRVPRGLALALMFVVGLPLAVYLGAVHRLVSVQGVITLAVLAAVGGVGTWLLGQRHVFLDLVPLALAAAATFVGVTYGNYMTERHHSRLVRNIFEHYLDPAVVRTLITDPARLRLGGEKRECTVLFTDLANFTATTEAMDPERVVRLMNTFLNAMTEIVIRNGGFVDKFIGDEIVAIFGAPADQPDHAASACRAVLAMRDRMRELQAAFHEFGCTGELFVRTGLSTGVIVVGNMGSEDRMNYTGMGDNMNLGARLEGANKQYGTRTLVSEAVVNAAGSEFRFRELDTVRLKGKARGIRLFELLDLAGSPAPDGAAFAAYAEGLQLYRAGHFADAATAFERGARLGDAPSDAMQRRCRRLAQEPPADWAGVYVMDTK